MAAAPRHAAEVQVVAAYPSVDADLLVVGTRGRVPWMTRHPTWLDAGA